MRHHALPVLLFVCALPLSIAHAQSTTLQNEQANDTPACTAIGAPAYCYLPASDEPPLSTASANQASNISPPIQTVTVDAVGHLENAPYLPIGKLMPKVGSSAWAGKVICEYQPWFSVNSQTSFGGNVGVYNGHIDIGYDEDINDPTNNPFNSSAPTQDTAMVNQGCNIDLIDFYGFIEPVQDFNQETTTSSVYQDLESRYNSNTQTYPMQFAVMEDKGAFSSACDLTGNESDEITCIENDLVSDMGSIYSNYIVPQLHAGLYWTDDSNGTARNVVAIFGACTDFTYLVCPTPTNPQDDWQTIWDYVYPTIASLDYNMEFIFEYGTFGYPAVPTGTPSYLNAGEFAWPQPFSGISGGPDCQSAKDCFIDYPTTQFWWCDPGSAGTELPCQGEGSGSKAYLDRFYTDAATNVPEGQIAVGLLYKGFDDSNASWWSDRVVAQQCGQVWMGTANELTYEANPGNTSYWASHQMPYMQVATWNDYEEGTEVESGISNCYDGVTDLLVEPQGGESGGSPTLEWSLSTTPAANVGGVEYATSNTINNFTIWVATQSHPDNISVLATVPGTQHSYYPFTPDLPAGNYYVYVEMVGKPMIQNAISSGLSFSVP